jgi:putative ABC transport system permease protein
MSFWRQLVRGGRTLTDRAAADRDLSDEVQHYLDYLTAELIARGLDPAAARRAALLELGNATVVREQVRTYGWENTVETLFGDLRYAARRLRTNPGFATVGILTLALGIGAGTAIFSAVNPILFAPLPYPHPDRIVTISDVGAEGARQDVTFGTYLELRARSRSFDALAVPKAWQPALTGGAEPERLNGQRVSASYFRALGVAPAAGREFGSAEDIAGGPGVVILSDALWRRRFGADRSIVGTQLMLNDVHFTVVGVMPPFENVLAPDAELWAPLQYATSFTPDSREWVTIFEWWGVFGPALGSATQCASSPRSLRRPSRSFRACPGPRSSRGSWCDRSRTMSLTM